MATQSQIRAAAAARRKEVLHMTREGVPRKQIARDLDMPLWQVDEDKNYLRRAGVLPPVQCAPKLGDHVRTGALAASFLQTEAKIRKWVEAQIPEGVTLAEFAVSCMVDAYHEENSSNDQDKT